MDPLVIGTTIGVTVVAQLTRELVRKVDPESIAKGVNWIFAAADSFIKIRKGQKPKDMPIPPPPVSVSLPESSATASKSDIEDKAKSVEKIAQSLEQPEQVPTQGGIHLAETDEFALSQLEREVESLLKQIEAYRRNLEFEENKAAQYGGLTFAPPIVMNTVRIQRSEIAKCVQRLNGVMEKAYGVSAPGLDELVDAARQ